MQTLFYVLAILSGLLGIVVGGLCFVIGWMLQSSYITLGWAVMFFSLLYLAHPTLVYWLFKIGHQTIAIGLTTLFMVCSVTLFFFVMSNLAV